MPLWMKILFLSEGVLGIFVILWLLIGGIKDAYFTKWTREFDKDYSIIERNLKGIAINTGIIVLNVTILVIRALCR